MELVILAQLGFSVVVWAAAIAYCLIRNWEIYWFGLLLYPLHVEMTIIRFGILLIQVLAFTIMQLTALIVALDEDMVTATSRNIKGLAARSELSAMQKKTKQLEGQLKSERKNHNRTSSNYSRDMKAAKAVIEIGQPTIEKFIKSLGSH